MEIRSLGSSQEGKGGRKRGGGVDCSIKLYIKMEIDPFTVKSLIGLGWSPIPVSTWIPSMS